MAIPQNNQSYRYGYGGSAGGRNTGSSGEGTNSNTSEWQRNQGGGGGGGSSAPSQSQSIQDMLAEIFGGEQFKSIQDQLMNANMFSGNIANQAGGIRDIGHQFRDIGMGGADPRFAAYQQSQFDVLRANELGQLGQTADFFTRRGGGNSTAALNALGRVSGGFDTQRQGLSGQIGMQQMQRQDQSLLSAAGLYGQAGNTFGQAGVARGQELDARQAALQNMLGQPELLIALMAAQNAGKGTDGGSGGLLGNFFDDILGTKQTSQ